LFSKLEIPQKEEKRKAGRGKSVQSITTKITSTHCNMKIINVFSYMMGWKQATTTAKMSMING
jgi:hypothetical protein